MLFTVKQSSMKAQPWREQATEGGSRATGRVRKDWKGPLPRAAASHQGAFRHIWWHPVFSMVTMAGAQLAFNVGRTEILNFL